MFDVPIQAASGGRLISRETVKAKRRDVRLDDRSVLPWGPLEKGCHPGSTIRWCGSERGSPRRPNRSFDALVELAGSQGSGRGGRRVRREALIRCDLAALRRGSVEHDEVCEVAGVGPVSVPQAVELLGEAAWKLLITKGVDVLHVTTLSRTASAAMLAALAWRRRACSVEGCGRTLVEIDHRIPFAATRRTTLSELDPLCDHHHDLKTHMGWELVAGADSRPFVPPDDPRHPSQARATAGADPPPAVR
jgi:hypothetical protein